MPSISQQFLHSILKYDPETGVFTWRERRGPVKAGDVAGSIDSSGYRQIEILGTAYLSGRLAWFYVHGVWPTDQIDHCDNNQLNDSFSNLREATGSNNSMNRRKRKGSKSKYIGVYPYYGKWRASICKDYKRILLGSFETEELAAAAYDAAAREKFGQFAKLNLASAEG